MINFYTAFEWLVIQIKNRERDECWEWPYSKKQKSGYGQLSVGGKKGIYAHVLAMELDENPKPADGYEVCHNCDNRSCVNPDHMYWGTRSNNVADMIDRNPPDRIKLTKEEAQKIKNIYVAGGITQKELGDQFGVSRETVSHIVQGRTWML